MAEQSDTGRLQYDRLKEYEATRQTELTELAEPYVYVTDLYGALLCRLVAVLGVVPPKGVQDHVVRDLMADAFDFLHESRSVLLKGKVDVAYPLIRRAYESISLMVLCQLDEKYAAKWQSGKQIQNSVVRKELSKHPMGESEKELKELYKFFSMASHPNRELVSHRYLGDGNQSILGSVDKPNLVLIADYCMKHLILWFWYGAFSIYTYREAVVKHDPGCIEAYHRASSEAPIVMKWLNSNYKNVLEEWKQVMKDQPPPRFQ